MARIKAEPACPACGLAYTRHAGLIGTCAALQKSIAVIVLLLKSLTPAKRKLFYARLKKKLAEKKQ